jgi:hypothetical protein
MEASNITFKLIELIRIHCGIKGRLGANTAIHALVPYRQGLFGG